MLAGLPAHISKLPPALQTMQGLSAAKEARRGGRRGSMPSRPCGAPHARQPPLPQGAPIPSSRPHPRIEPRWRRPQTPPSWGSSRTFKTAPSRPSSRPPRLRQASRSARGRPARPPALLAKVAVDCMPAPRNRRPRVPLPRQGAALSRMARRHRRNRATAASSGPAAPPTARPLSLVPASQSPPQRPPSPPPRMRPPRSPPLRLRRSLRRR